MTRPVSEILADLDAIAGRILAAPYVAFGYRQPLPSLREEIAFALARPATVRTIDDTAAMLVTCLINLAVDGDPRWGDIARVLRPYVAQSLKASIEQELHEMTDHS
jgi:hypothetical protein